MTNYDIFNTSKISQMNELQEKELIEGTPFKDKWEMLDCYMMIYEEDEKKSKIYTVLYWIYFWFLLIQIPYGVLSSLQDFFEPIEFLFFYYHFGPIWGFIILFPFIVSVGFFDTWMKEKRNKVKSMLSFVQENKNDWLKNRNKDRRHIKELVGYLKKWKK